MGHRSSLRQLVCLPTIALLVALLTGCSPVEAPPSSPTTQAPAPSQTPAPTPTQAPPTKTSTPEIILPTGAPARALPELTYGADRWRLADAAFHDEVSLTAGPQQQTLTADENEGFVVLELESLTGKDLFRVFVQYGADLSTVYLSDSAGIRYPTLQFTATGVPADRFTIIFEASPKADAAGLAFHFLDAEAVPLAELLSTAPVVEAPTGEPYYLYVFCNCEDEVPAEMAPILRWAWLTTTEQYLEDFIAASSTTVLIDGKPYTGLEAYWGEVAYSADDRGYKSQWIYPLPSLPSGTHKVEISLSLDRAVTDGYDGNADGSPDQYGPGDVFYGWVEVRIAAPYGPPSEACANGAPAGHWALIVNKASAGAGTITIDGQSRTVQSGRNIIYLTADVSHPVLVGTSTINFSAPECGENTLEIP